MSKVTDIDWNEAPTDTAVWIVQSGCDLGVWHHPADDEGNYKEIGDPSFWPADSEQRGKITVHRRSEQEPVEWMPIVGQECELKYKHSSAAEWFPFKLIASDEGVMFGWTENDPTNVKFVDYEFRPLRTEDEKKRDAFIDTCVELTGLADLTYRKAFGLLYDNNAAFGFNPSLAFKMSEGEG